MIKRLIVTIFIFCLTNSSTIAECVTGYACSIKDLQEKQQMQENLNKNSSAQKLENTINSNNDKSKNNDYINKSSFQNSFEKELKK